MLQPGLKGRVIVRQCVHQPYRGGTIMSQSLANIVVHLVFSTKDRRPLLRDAERGQLHAYITGILNNQDSPLIEINSVPDHIHVLFAQSKNHAPAKIVEQIKTASSGWIKTLDAWYRDFAWQGGYGEFSVPRASPWAVTSRAFSPLKQSFEICPTKQKTNLLC